MLMYIGTEVTEKCDLRSLHNYSNLLSQFKDMIAIFQDKIFGAASWSSVSKTDAGTSTEQQLS